MARLAAADLAAATLTDVYTVPANRRATFTVNFCNRSAAERTVRLALCSGAIQNADYIEFDTALPANGVLERTGLMLTAGQLVRARANSTDVSCVVWGAEEQV